MSEVHDKLTTHRVRLEEAADALEEQHTHGDDGLDRAKQAAWTALTAMRSRLDARVGMALAGMSSSGKSQLVAVLLGASDLLPVAVRATTGNVTELVLVPAEEGAPTAAVGGPIIEFLDRDEIEVLASKLVDALVGAYAGDIRDDDVELLKAGPLADGFAAVDRFLAREWPRTEDTHRCIVVRQLLDLRDAVTLGPNLVGAAPLDAVASPASLLQLPEQADRPHPAAFYRASGMPLDRDSLRVAGDPERRAFPLIKRVRYRIAVHPGTWPLLGLPDGQPLVLLDFPGFNGGFSPVRDTFLAENEFGDIHTAAACMAVDQVHLDVVEQVQKLLSAGRASAPDQRDRSLFVIATKFDDQAVPDHEGAAPPFTDGALKLLDDHRRGALRGDYDRMALTSAVRAIVAEGQAEPVGTSEAMTEFRDHAAGAARRLPRWTALAERMRQEQQGSGWPDLLDAVAVDGGVRRLRGALVQHVATHGASIKAGWVDREFEALVAALRRIRTAERAFGWQETEGSADVARNYLTLVRKAARELREAAGGLADTAPIEKIIAAEAIDQVYQWPVWGSVLDRIEPRDNFVVPVTGQHDDTRHDRTDPLQDSFAELVGELIKLATDSFYGFTEEWLDTLHEATAQIRSDWDDAMETDLAGLLRRLQKDPDKAAMADTAIAEMRDIRAVLGAQIETAMDDLEKRSADPDTFPLRARHYLPWAMGSGVVTDDETARHQSVVLRMRGNVADAAVEVVSELLRGMAVTLAEEVRRHAARVTDTVPPPAPARPGPVRPPRRPRPGDDPVEIEPGEVAELLTKWGVF